MRIIVGLGNPGAKYKKTRHNVGFRVVERLAEKLGGEFARKKFKGEYAEGDLPNAWQGPKAGDGKLLLVKPQTYMNLSGETVIGFLGYFKADAGDLLVVVDDVALPVGRLRMRREGSCGGHNGLRDIEQRLGHNAFARLRVGVGGREHGGEGAPRDLAGHVLAAFGADEEKVLEEAMDRAVEACLCWAGQGPEDAMNRFNAAG